MARIIDAILVKKNSPNQSAELDQRVPVAAIAGQARRLDCEHGANTPSQIAARRRETKINHYDKAQCRTTANIAQVNPTR